MAKNHSSNPLTPRKTSAMFPGDRFVAVPEFVSDDVASGTISLGMAAVFQVLLKQCDYETGMWRGSAPKVQDAIAEAMTKRTVQNHLEKLVEVGYIKSFHQQGKRGNYFVAICDYRVRNGEHAGMLLDANATTDATKPVFKKYEEPDVKPEKTSEANAPQMEGSPWEDQRDYESPKDSKPIQSHRLEEPHQRNNPSGDEPSAQDQRNLSETSAQPQRNVSETSAKIGGPVFARALDSRCLDVPDVQDSQESQDSTSTSTAQNPAAGDADGHSTSNTFGQEEAFDRDAFLAAQAKLLHEANHTQTTTEHIELSCQLAVSNGPAVYLAGLRYWLDEEADDDLSIGEETNERTGQTRTKYRTWALHYFLTNPGPKLWIERARAFYDTYGVTGDTLDFFTDLGETAIPMNLTSEQVAKVTAAIAIHDGDVGLLRSAFREFDYDRNFFDDPCAYVVRLRAKWEQERAERAERLARQKPTQTAATTV